MMMISSGSHRNISISSIKLSFSFTAQHKAVKKNNNKKIK